MTPPIAAPDGSDTLRADLEPVRRALLSDARTDAARLIADAERAANERIDAATRDAQATVDRAVQRSQSAAQAAADQQLAAVRNGAAATVLTARDDLHRRLVDATRTAYLELRDDARYPRLLDHFATLARRQLGDGATIDRDPDPDGGIVATEGSRRVDYSLPSLADRALDALADRVAEVLE